MLSGGLVHWHEGLFLEPHHLQMMQHQMIERFGFERRLGRGYPYGLLDYEISEDELENMHVRFTRLSAIMPSGVVVDVPGNAELPLLDIREKFKAGATSVTVILGVPFWYPDRANSVEQKTDDAWQVKSLYRVQEVESTDENTGQNPRPLQVRKINARLFLEGDDATDIEQIPVLKIVRAGDRPEMDESYIPPCYALNGSPVLKTMVQDLANQVEANRRELVVQVTRGGFSAEAIRGLQIEQLHRLKTLNKFSARLPAIARAPGVSPFEVYLELGELLGELAALQPDRDPFKLPSYDHDHPGSTFPELCENIRAMLRGEVGASYLKESFVVDPDARAMFVTLSDEDVTLANEYYLSVKTGEDPKALAKLLEDPDRFKLLPKSLIKRRVRGVRLAEERHPPLEFPAETGRHYFRLMRDESPKIWEQIKREKVLGATWRGIDATDYSLTLCMTVPEVGS